MGLDWNPLNKPKPGHEAEFAALLGTITHGYKGWQATLKSMFGLLPNEKQQVARLQAISIAPHETLKVPRVGSDAAADNWARALYAAKKPQDQSERDFIAALAGYYVTELVPACDGKPWYSHGAMGYVDHFSFRAQFLVKDCAAILGPALVERCYVTCEAPQLAQLSADLVACGLDFAKQHGLEGVMRQAEAPEPDTPASQAHIIGAAARWARFWAERGHGMEAYF